MFHMKTFDVPFLPFYFLCGSARQMQSDGLQEEATVAGVLSHAITQPGDTRRNNLQGGWRPSSGHAGHSGAENLWLFPIKVYVFYFIWIKITILIGVATTKQLIFFFCFVFANHKKNLFVCNTSPVGGAATFVHYLLNRRLRKQAWQQCIRVLPLLHGKGWQNKSRTAGWGCSQQ